MGFVAWLPFAVSAACEAAAGEFPLAVCLMGEWCVVHPSTSTTVPIQGFDHSITRYACNSEFGLVKFYYLDLYYIKNFF